VGRPALTYRIKGGAASGEAEMHSYSWCQAMDVLHSTKPELTETEQLVHSLIDPSVVHYLEECTRKGGLTLEVGCGAGQYRQVLASEYVGVDLSKEDCKEGLPRTPDLLAEACTLPFRNDSITTVFYSGILYYLSNQRLLEAIAEANRVLKPEGSVLIHDHSKKTDEYLQVQYRKAAPSNNPYIQTANPRSCSYWLKLLSRIGFSQVDISFKSYGGIKPRVLLLKRLLPRWLYFAWIDHRLAYIIITGTKAKKPPK
jgi:SAM-dependent methyltransferase